MNRRHFSRSITLGGFGFPLSAKSMDTLDSLSQKISLGVIADLHVDLIPDGAERLDSFLDEMTKTKPDALIQMGDFSFAKESNQKIVDRFEELMRSLFMLLGTTIQMGGSQWSMFSNHGE